MKPKTLTQLPLAALAARSAVKHPLSRRKEPRAGTVVLVDGQECYQIPVGKNGQVMLVDKADYAMVSQYYWHVSSDYWNPYVVRSVYADKKCSMVRLHRQLLGFPNCEIDHINQNSLDNRRCNLRLATTAQNQWNSRKRKVNRTGFKGVQENNSRKNPWKAIIKRQHLGSFPTAELAAQAFDKAARELYGEYACVNFPGEAKNV